YKDDISEYEHMMRNIAPFIDASIQKVPDYRVRYFESTLQATAIHRNLGGDHTEHARMGYRVDVLIKLPGLHCTGVLISDVAKFRGVFQAKDQLNGVNTSNLVVWGFTVV
ncbi:14204_t:CDS:2, partial [Rhizophagus irregularis]